MSDWQQADNLPIQGNKGTNPTQLHSATTNKQVGRSEERAMLLAVNSTSDYIKQLKGFGEQTIKEEESRKEKIRSYF